MVNQSVSGNGAHAVKCSLGILGPVCACINLVVAHLGIMAVCCGYFVVIGSVLVLPKLSINLLLYVCVVADECTLALEESREMRLAVCTCVGRLVLEIHVLAL